MSIAVRGTGVNLAESGEIAILEFKLLSNQETEISLTNVDLRDSANQKLRSSFEGTGVVVTGRLLPEIYALHQNHPNPFSAVTSINYQIPEDAQITLKIYDVAGKLLRTLVNEVKEPGYYTVRWDGKDELGKNVGNGIYFYKLETIGSAFTMKMTLVR